jgi:hypothetical protein
VSTGFTESTVEEAALARLNTVGRQIVYGPEIAPDMLAAEQRDYSEMVLAQRLRAALARLNQSLPSERLEEAYRNVTRPEGAGLIQRNRALHCRPVDGATVAYRDAEGSISTGRELDSRGKRAVLEQVMGTEIGTGALLEQVLAGLWSFGYGAKPAVPIAIQVVALFSGRAPP